MGAANKVKGIVRISNSIYNEKITKNYTLDALAKITDRNDKMATVAESQQRKQILSPAHCKIVITPIGSIKNQGYDRNVLDMYF